MNRRYNNFISNRNNGFMKSFYFDMISDLNFSEIFNNDFEQTNIEVNIKDEEDMYVIEGFFPGIEKKDIRIDYKDEHLHFRVKRNQVFSNGGNGTMFIIKDSNDFIKDFYVPNSNSLKLRVSFKEYRLRLELPKICCDYANENIIDVEDYEDA